MAVLKGGVSRCGLCRFYNHEGRRGGTCSQLNSPVSAKWESCRLAASPFKSGRDRKEMTVAAQNRWLVLETAFELVASPTVSTAIAAEPTTRKSNRM